MIEIHKNFKKKKNHENIEIILKSKQCMWDVNYRKQILNLLYFLYMIIIILLIFIECFYTDTLCIIYILRILVFV